MNYTTITDTIGIYFREIRKYGSLTAEDEARLFPRIKAGDRKALDEVVGKMSGLAVMIAKKYTGDPDLLQDLIQEAYCGILEAVSKYDISSGYRFSTYARYWMMANISTFLGKVKTVYPTNQRLMAVARKIREEFLKENHREISDYELMERLEDMGEVVTDLTAITSVKVSSISEPDGDGGRTFEDSAEFNGKTADCFDDGGRSLTDDIRMMMEILSPREKTLVSLKYGIGTGVELTNAEVAREWNRRNPGEEISQERCRQIINDAVRKMGKGM